MKKVVKAVPTLAILVLLAGCGQESSTASRTANNGIQITEVLEDQMAAADAENSTVTVSTPSSYNSSSDEADSESSNEAASDAASSSTVSLIEFPTPDESSAYVSGAEGIDIDLTVLSSTMVYSQVYEIVFFPENYVGKTMKMEGIYTHLHDDATGNDYFACIIQDATACCAQGIEFILTDDYTYPDDYPEEGDIVCVEGMFDTYEENGDLYCTLRDAQICE